MVKISLILMVQLLVVQKVIMMVIALVIMILIQLVMIQTTILDMAKAGMMVMIMELMSNSDLALNLLTQS